MRPNISKTEEYGWLLATGSPIYDGNGELIAIVNVDISMNIAMAELMRFMNFIICAFAAVTVLICVLAILLMRKLIIKPISILSHAATQYKSNSTAFSELNMKRKDEIGILADSMAKMEKDINGYISELTSAREHADKMDRVANTDALTKALSKRAYDRKARQLNEYKTPYGIALVDINDLKGINDTYGHEKGDISIQTVCRFISRVFGRSAVYRIGGDEFVVVLENENYKKRDALIRELLYSFRANEANTSLQPWERASAAIGYAIYDPDTDENAESVFQRADAAMYENKKALKKAK
jgi:diguanylate cyclase (GGDEF)-like protein